MKIFLDTSSLVKLYHRKTGTDELEQMFSKLNITPTFLSEIPKAEFTSTIWKKVRTKEITESQAQITLKLFETDFPKFIFRVTDSLIIEQARILISKYGRQGLRTLDSIQLSTSISLSKTADLFLTGDNLLKSFFKAEDLQTEISVSF